MINFDSFSHGQIASKMWLCEHLEPVVPLQSTATILGSWYNVLGFMLMVRNPYKFKSIHGIDIDADAIAVADKICDTWSNVTNTNFDVNSGDYPQSDVVINCSPEHMEGSAWFDKIQKGTIVCIQTSNVIDPCAPWYIKTPCPTFEVFQDRYPMNTTHLCDKLEIRYATGWGYDRYMVIGVK